MKRLNLLFACIGVMAIAINAQAACTVTDFTTQAAIDNFPTNSSNCTEITGDVNITGSDIVNLTGLAAVTSIGGHLNIDGTNLTNLTGLGALATLGGYLRIASNGSLTSIAALSKITTVNGFLSVGLNNVLTSLTGLQNITSITGAVSLGSNNALIDFGGLSGLLTINGFLSIANNPALTSVAGLSKLTALSTSTGPTSSGNALTITENGALTTLSGLDNIASSSINSLTIQNSGNLSVCGVRSICVYLNRPLSVRTISGNAVGCATDTEISSTGDCQRALPVDLVSFTGRNSSEGNILEWRTTSESNNAGFAVEKSTNARVFEEIGYVKGNNNSSELKYYSFADTAPAATSYYRLKQMDHDNTFTYSRMITVSSIGDNNAISIYPNPASGVLNIKGKDVNQKFSILTANGVTIQESSQVPSKPIDTSGFKNGLYLVTVGQEVFKVLVVN